jgi:hypothetical protein
MRSCVLARSSRAPLSLDGRVCVAASASYNWVMELIEYADYL